MKRYVRAALRLAAASCVLSVSLAFAGTSLLLPYEGPISKAQRHRSFQSEGRPMRVNLQALKTLRHGDEVDFALPDGGVHTFVFDLLKDEGMGVTSWVGYRKDSPDKQRAIITTGPGGSFGRILTPEGEFTLVPGEGFDWLVDMKQEQPFLPAIDLHDDVLVPDVPKRSYPQANDPEYLATVEGVNSVALSKATPPQVVVDLMVVYTQTYGANLGTSLQTRLNYLVTSANTAYADSEVGIVLRLVHSVAVNYSDTATGNSQALDEITPVGTGGTGPFANIEALRTQYGADMVTFLRNGSDFGGSGIAWIANSPMSAGFDRYMYSVVTGCVRSCEWVWIHEVAHNMGNQHDRATTAWQNSGATPAGSYPYSFGYYSCHPNVLSCSAFTGACTSRPECSVATGVNNISDIMAYFHSSTTRNLKFSNPNVTCRGDLNLGEACGIADGLPGSADAARSMNNNRVALSALRATVVAAGASPARLANISTRGAVLTGADVMIGGFVIGGTASKTVAIVATGPSLAAYGITNPLADPMLTLVRQSDGAVLATNDNWQSAANAAQLQAAGFAPTHPLEAAILVTLPPGAYTALVSGTANGTGVGVVAVYEVDRIDVPLVNISTRGRVGTGADVMIGGFVIQGGSPQQLAILATGPSLAAYGIANALANPTITLVRSSDQAVIATNDNWQSAANAAQLQAAGFAPSNPLEAALLVTLDPGAYTVILSGVGGTTGVGVIAAYTVQ